LRTYSGASNGKESANKKIFLKFACDWILRERDVGAPAPDALDILDFGETGDMAGQL
jgi:hypothetical protein